MNKKIQADFFRNLWKNNSMNLNGKTFPAFDLRKLHAGKKIQTNFYSFPFLIFSDGLGKENSN